MTAKPQLSLVVNPQTGEVTEEGCPWCAEKEDTIAGLQHDNRSLATKNGALKRELKGLRAAEPEHDQVLEVLDYWRAKCMVNARFTVGDARWQKVRGLLKAKDASTGELCYSVRHLKAAVDGALSSDFHVKKGYVDAKTIFRDTDTVDGHIARLRAPQQSAQADRMPAPQALYPTMDRFLEACDRINSRKWVKAPNEDLWVVRCPACRAGDARDWHSWTLVCSRTGEGWQLAAWCGCPGPHITGALVEAEKAEAAQAVEARAVQCWIAEAQRNL